MSVKSSATVFHALRCLAAEPGSIGAAELAERLLVPVTTAARCLATLEAAGYADRQYRSSRFTLGKSARTLAFAFMAQFPVRDLAMPYLQQLTLESALTSSLFLRLGWFTVRIGQILGAGVLIHQTRLGQAADLTTGAPSMSVLAFLDGREFDRALEGAGKQGDADLRQMRFTIRADGIAVQRSLADPLAFDVAMPLLDQYGRAIASVAVEGVPEGVLPSVRDPAGRPRRIMQDLAAKISDEQTVELAHYDHIDPDRIRF